MKTDLINYKINKEMQITVVGLGVIGGSYLKGLQELGYTNIYGIDTNKSTLTKAYDLKLIKNNSLDKDSEDKIIRSSDLIIIALYPNLVKKFISDHVDIIKSGCVITDVTGVKMPIINNILKILPNNIDFVFGHPMAGREKKGLDYSTNEVFKGANYIITPTIHNKEKNIEMIKNMALDLGFAQVKLISPEFHDAVIAYTSQLTHAIAVALVNSDIEERDTENYIGDSFRDLTRIAKINEELWSELFLDNKDNLLSCIDNFQSELDKIKEALIKNDKIALEALFKKSSSSREKYDKKNK